MRWNKRVDFMTCRLTRSAPILKHIPIRAQVDVIYSAYDLRNNFICLILMQLGKGVNNIN